jgi:superfamily II DNA or RNA helicase
MSYDRLAGFFSSRALAVAARGIAGLIGNGGHMRLAASPRLQPDDIAALRDGVPGTELDSLLTERMTGSLSLADLQDEIEQNHVRALCWMLAQGLLEIRLVLPVPRQGSEGGIYHQKIGVLTDADANVISFSGSINETAKGWLGNIEQFKVFRGWVPVEAEYVEDDVRAFLRYWDGTSDSARTVDLPSAVREGLLSLAPDNVESLDLSVARESRTPWRTAAKRSFVLRPYQQDAIDAWFAAGGRGILEMATGTGKTKTALSAVKRLADDNACVFLVVSVPYQHLATQWRDEVMDIFPGADIVLAGGGNVSWRRDVLDLTARLAMGVARVGIVIVVHNTAASAAFLAEVARAASVCQETVLVADEMHALGAPKFRAALGDDYKWRLGLSATPERWFDDAGTDVLRDFFGEVVYTFGIAEALRMVDPATGKTVLTPYTYHPHFISLTDAEIEEYQQLTQRAIRAKGQDTGADGQTLEELLMFLRARVAKKAEQKVDVLESFLTEYGSSIGHCIIYCIDSEQMEIVSQCLTKRGVVYRYFTGDEGTRTEGDGMSERQRILRSFERGDTQVLVAMKCLDEGVDVKQAQLGLILASSTNPREFIQRRGRLLRRAAGKEKAVIHDVILRPDIARMAHPDTRETELRILKKELERLGEFAACADNATECYALVLEELSRLTA